MPDDDRRRCQGPGWDVRAMSGRRSKECGEPDGGPKAGRWIKSPRSKSFPHAVQCPPSMHNTVIMQNRKLGL